MTGCGCHDPAVFGHLMACGAGLGPVVAGWSMLGDGGSDVAYSAHFPADNARQPETITPGIARATGVELRQGRRLIARLPYWLVR